MPLAAKQLRLPLSLLPYQSFLKIFELAATLENQSKNETLHLAGFRIPPDVFSSFTACTKQSKRGSRL